MPNQHSRWLAARPILTYYENAFLRQGSTLMSALSEIRPRKRQRIIDLVRAAGVNVSDWANFKGGKRKAASNPKYCYEWAFVEPKKVVVLNLWYAEMEERDGVVVRDLNMREIAQQSGRPSVEKNRTEWSGLLAVSVWRCIGPSCQYMFS